MNDQLYPQGTLTVAKASTESEIGMSVAVLFVMLFVADVGWGTGCATQSLCMLQNHYITQRYL